MPVGLSVGKIEGTLEKALLGRLDFGDTEGIELGDVEGNGIKVGLFIMGASGISVGFLDFMVGTILGVRLGNRLLMSVGRMLGTLEIGPMLSGRKLGNETGTAEIGGIVGPLATTGLSVNGETE